MTLRPKAITLSPNEIWPYLIKAFNIWSWKGPNKQSRDALKHVGIENDWYLYSWYWQEVGDGNYKAALQLLSDTSMIGGGNNKMWAIQKQLYSAFIYQYLDDNELAQKDYKTAVILLE